MLACLTHPLRRSTVAPAAVLCAFGLAALMPSEAAAAVSFASTDSDRRIRLGSEAVFEGDTAPARSGRRVTLLYAPAGGSLRQVDETTTGVDGRYQLAFRPRYSGRFRAVAHGMTSAQADETSDRVRVGVHARIAGDGPDHVRRSNTHTVSGTLRPARSGRVVRLEKYYPDTGWRAIASDETASDGSYRLSWTPVGIGSFQLRVRFDGDERNLPVTRRVPGGVNVYRATVASWYGPGLYGNRTACGQTLRTDTRGVAHKTLPCGTLVRFYYRGRTVVVPVIDRGPYIDGRTWDLTYATKRSLGFPDGVDTVLSTR